MLKKKSLELLGYNVNRTKRKLNIVTTQIYLENIEKEYVFWQVSDCHISFTQKRKLINSYRQRNNHWILDGYDDPLYSLDKLVTKANKTKLDGILFCGDIIDFYSKENVKYIKNKINKLKTNPIITLGNHERSENPFLDNDSKFYKSFKSWKKTNLSFYSIDYKDFLIAVIDDSNQKINKEQLNFIKSLAKYNKPIFLVLHIPIITKGLAPKCMKVWGPTFMLGTNICDETTMEFVKYVKIKKSNINSIFAGHIHYENISSFKKNCNQYCSAPSFLGYIREIKISPNCDTKSDTISFPA